MKNSILLFALVFSVAISHAQNPVIGLKGGINLSSIDNSGEAVFSNRLGFNGGLYLTVPVSPVLSVQPEVVYSAQGGKYNLDGINEHNLTLNYVNIPVMLQANIGRGVYAEAGPQIGLLVGAKDQVNKVESGYFTSQDFKKTDVGLGLGLGYRIDNNIGISVRYNLGLSNINNYGTNTLRNNTLQVGLTLGLGR